MVIVHQHYHVNKLLLAVAHAEKCKNADATESRSVYFLEIYIGECMLPRSGRQISFSLAVQ